MALDPFEVSPSIEAHRPFFTSGARVWGAVALPPFALAMAGLARALRRWRERRISERDDAHRNDPLSLMRQADDALAAGHDAKAADLAGRALERARKEFGAPATDAARDAMRDAQAACDTLRFGGSGAARDAVEKGRAAVRAMEGGA